MVFAEKLVFLMKLTATSNKQLAEAVNVDPSLISLLRTARRGAPKNIAHTRAMASYFAKKCEGNYQRIALSEALGRKYLQLQMETEQLASILLDWLTDSRDQVGQFLNTFEHFSLEDAEFQAGALPAEARNDGGSYVYYGSEGKRGAVNAFVSHLLSLKKPGTVLLATDESLEWLLENPAYYTQLREKILLLLQKGFRLCRIAAPIYTAEQAFDSISYLMPLYLTGQVESYYYPRLRDDVYHRTLMVLPEVSAVVATSVGSRPGNQAIFFTQDTRLTNVLSGEFQDFLSQCRPMMTTYSTEGNAEALLRCISQFESDKGNRIQQSTTLSAITTPPELFRLSASTAPEPEAAAIVQTLLSARALFRQSLAEYEVFDIHSLATAQEVRAGTVPLGPTYLRRESPLFHTPETYIAHLQSILEHIETYPNYHAVLRPRDAQSHALMVKDGRQALLLRPGTPLMVFEVSQPYVAEACREYLMRLIKSPYSPEIQRKNVISQLRLLIEALRRP